MKSEDRAGLYITVIFHLLIIIVLLACQIGAALKRENTFVLDFTKQEEVEKKKAEENFKEEVSDRLDQLREVDDIMLTELHKTGLYNEIFQHLTIDLPYASEKNRASFVLRPVCSEDVMTARFAWFSAETFKSIVEKIAALPFVDALYFDATNKPPATFGWE